MKNRIDRARAGYWRIYFIQPADPDDDRCVMLHGEQNEIVGPLTMGLAEAWMDRFDSLRPTGEGLVNAPAASS